MVGKGTHLQVILQQSTQNTASLLLQTYEKTIELFLLLKTGVDFSLRNMFANSGSFAKVSVPVHNYSSLNSISQFKDLSFHKTMNDDGIWERTDLPIN